MTLAEFANNVRIRHGLDKSQTTIQGIHVNKLVFTCFLKKWIHMSRPECDRRGGRCPG